MSSTDHFADFSTSQLPRPFLPQISVLKHPQYALSHSGGTKFRIQANLKWCMSYSVYLFLDSKREVGVLADILYPFGAGIIFFLILAHPVYKM